MTPPDALDAARDSLTHMAETKQRSLLERIVGRPLPWIVWAWAVLAAIWIVVAVVEPSGFHTFMAIAWSILAIVQLGGAYAVRRREQVSRESAETDDH